MSAMTMSRVRRSWGAGILLISAGMTAAAQEPGQLPRRAPAGPPDAANTNTAYPPAREPDSLFGPGGITTEEFPGSVPGGPCDCRRGLFGWRKHKADCKQHLERAMLGFADEFNEWPLGWSLYANMRAQVGNAEAAKLVFYHFDFVDGTPRLNLRGRDKLVNVMQRMSCSFDPVIIERTPKEPGLDVARRLTVAAALSGGPFPVPGERVVVGTPIANGLRGPDAEIMNLNRLSAVRNQGALGQAAGVQGFDGGGLSGAAASGIGAGATPR